LSALLLLCVVIAFLAWPSGSDPKSASGPQGGPDHRNASGLQNATEPGQPPPLELPDDPVESVRYLVAELAMIPLSDWRADGDTPNTARVREIYSYIQAAGAGASASLVEEIRPKFNVRPRLVDHSARARGEYNRAYRRAAITLLGKLDHPEADSVLKDVAIEYCHSTEIRSTALLVLVERRGVDALSEVARSERGGEDVIRALGEIGTQEAIDAIVDYATEVDAELRNGRRPPNYRGLPAAIEILGKSNDARAEPVLVALAKTGGNRFDAALDALASREPAPVNILIDLLRDERLYVDYKEAVGERLLRIGEPAIEPLIKLFNSQNDKTGPTGSWQLFDLCLNVLGKTGDARVVEPFIQAIQQDEELRNDELRMHRVTGVLGRIDDPKVTVALARMMLSGQKGAPQAAVALRYQGLRAVPSLTSALYHVDVSRHAAESLAYLGEPGIAPLTDFLSGTTDGTPRQLVIEGGWRESTNDAAARQARVATSLTKIDSPKVIAPLLQIFVQPKLPLETQGWILAGLHGRPEPEAGAALTEILDRGNLHRKLRDAIIRGLAHRKFEPATAVMRKILDAADQGIPIERTAKVGLDAAEALGQLAGVPYLRELLEHQDLKVRIITAKALRNRVDVPILRELLQHQDLEVRIVIAEALGRARDRESYPSVCGVFNEVNSLDDFDLEKLDKVMKWRGIITVIEAMRAIAPNDERTHVAMLWLDARTAMDKLSSARLTDILDQQELVRPFSVSIIEELDRRKYEPAVPTFLKFLDAGGAVRLASHRALGNLASVELLRELLEDQDLHPPARTAIASELGRARDTESYPSLCRLFDEIESLDDPVRAHIDDLAEAMIAIAPNDRQTHLAMLWLDTDTQLAALEKLAADGKARAPLTAGLERAREALAKLTPSAGIRRPLPLYDRTVIVIDRGRGTRELRKATDVPGYRANMITPEQYRRSFLPVGAAAQRAQWDAQVRAHERRDTAELIKRYEAVLKDLPTAP